MILGVLICYLKVKKLMGRWSFNNKVIFVILLLKNVKLVKLIGRC